MTTASNSPPAGGNITPMTTKVRRPRRRQRAELPAEHLSKVRAILYLSGMRGADLDDAVQEVQLRALQQPLTSVKSMSAWLSVVTANLATDWHRRGGRDRAMRDTLVQRAAVSNPEPDLALKNAVTTGLASLDPDLRAVVILRFYVDLPIRDIAQHLHVPEGTVKSRLHRAITAMREILPKGSLAG